MKITEDFIGNETKELTKTKIATILRWWGFNPDSYSTWGNARTDMNNILSGASSSTISDRERASSFLSKINYINDTDTVISNTLFAANEPGVWYDPSDLSTLYQDPAGTTPVTAVEQPVGLMLDKSKGLGPELVTNGDFSQWSGDNPVGWNVQNEDATHYVTQHANGARFVSDTTTPIMALKGYRFLAGKTYRVEIEVTDVVSGTVKVDIENTSTILAAGVNRFTLTFTAGKDLNIYRNSANVDLVIKRVSVRELPGNHASQATTTARPILSARYNLLYNTPWEGAVIGTAETCLPPTGWVKGFWTSGSIDAITDVNGDKALTFTATSGRIQFSQALSVKENDVLVSKVDVLATSGLPAAAILEFTGSGTRQFFFNGSPIANNALISQPGQLSCSFTAGVGTTSVSPRFGIGTNAAVSGTVTVCRPDFRLAVDVPNLPSYQRVVSSSEYSTEGFPYYLRFDGVDDFLDAGTLNFSAATQSAAVIGIKKLSDAIAARPYSHGLSTGQNGAFRFFAPANAGQASVRAASRGADGVLREIAGVNDKAAPIKLVLCSTYGANAPVFIRYNGTESRVSSGTLGALVLPSARSVIGAQVTGETTQSSFFLGRIYGLVHIARELSPVEQRILEQFIRNKSRAY